ncbi:ribonuclease p complex subunit [Ophiostoma piceae UAMH 11346]|uniref:Ribonuclease p complex subunit n=1 Tax=Ophiostoma piceae (strain UAMH 11346) TaxID=1262450 RepID=S3BVU2_OPHP1|nr:ribonuclease p complex subunit [Ophiostoma piceae UAMH 11346]
MCIVFTCGEHTFRKEVEGYEGIICRCFNCGNYSGHVIKTHPWFTFCFVPVIPLSIHGYEDVTCHICNFKQPLEHREDIQAMRGTGGGTGPPPGGPPGVPMQPQGPPPGQSAMRYG